MLWIGQKNICSLVAKHAFFLRILLFFSYIDLELFNFHRIQNTWHNRKLVTRIALRGIERLGWRLSGRLCDLYRRNRWRIDRKVWELSRSLSWRRFWKQDLYKIELSTALWSLPTAECRVCGTLHHDPLFQDRRHRLR